MQLNQILRKPILSPDNVLGEWIKIYLLYAIGLASIGASAIPWDGGESEKAARLFLPMVGLGSVGYGVKKTRELEILGPALGDRTMARRDIAAHTVAHQAMEYLDAPSAMVEEQPAQLMPSGIEWGRVLAAPHLAIVGKTGSGKSALTQWLSSQLPGEVVVYDSDAGPHEWQGLKVIGRGANYEAIASAMEDDLAELQTRTEARAVGKTDFPLKTIILEESPETLAALKDGGHEIGYQWLKGILRRGRKYGIKLILLSQGFSVRSLRIEGEGELRDNISVVRLGKVAIAHGKSKLGEVELATLKQQPRPALIDDEVVGSAPDLSRFLEGQKAKPPATPPLEKHTAPDTQTHIREALEAIYSQPSTVPHTQPHTNTQQPPDTEKCPSCGSVDSVGNGATASGKPRRRCKNCGKSWTQ